MSNIKKLQHFQIKEKKPSNWIYGFLIVSIILRLASPSTANLSYLIISIYALFGRTHAIQALALSWLFTMINPELAPEASAGSVGRYFVIICATLSVVTRNIGRNISINKLSLMTWLLGVLLLIHSFLFSVVLEVSLLKIIAWMIVVLTLISAWQGISILERSVLFKELENCLVILLLLCLPFLAIPSIGYAVNGTGFQGILAHPQSFGPTVAMIGAIIGGRVLAEAKPLWRDIAILGLCLILIILSEARIAGFALILGILISIVFYPIISNTSRRNMLPGLRSKKFLSLCIAAVLAILISGPYLVEQVSNYFLKRTDSADLLSVADASRGKLVEVMLSNIAEQPFTGIGFGVASNPAEMDIERDSVFGLPTSVKIEKGVMPVAILEELGIFGAFFVVAWLIMIFQKGARVGISQFVLLCTLLLINLGESIFFSVGGMGMLLLILLTGAITGKPQFNKRNMRD